jgi:ferredoxin-thioredoxin reductase catalytic subunit
MSEDQITDLSPEEEATLRAKYRREMVELADRFCEERGYVLTNAEMTIEDTICVCPPVQNGLVDFEGTCFCNFFSLPEGKAPLKETLSQGLG